jgi:hypothetical protein
LLLEGQPDMFIDPSAHPDPPLGMPDPPPDWFVFWVRFICGLLFGAFIGGLLWLRYFYRDLGEFAWVTIPAAALICAFAAARGGDNFWAKLRFLRAFWWWR